MILVKSQSLSLCIAHASVLKIKYFVENCNTHLLSLMDII